MYRAKSENRLRQCDNSGSAVLRIRHCRTSDTAEREALAAWDDILLARKTIERTAAAGDRMRLELAAALRGLE